MKELYVLGNGAFGREVLTLLSEINSTMCRMKYEREDIEFLDDNDPRCRAVVELPCDAPYVCAVNNPRLRRKIAERVNGDAVTLIHPGVVHQTYGKYHAWVDGGSIVCEQVILMPGVVVGKHCHINTGTHIGHDSQLGDYVTISSQCNVMGGVTIGDGVELQSGCRVGPGLLVGDGCVVGPGCVVTRSMPRNTKCMNPSPIRDPGIIGEVETWKYLET